MTKSKISADLILQNGKIITVDSSFSIAEAVAIRRNEIVGVGVGSSMLELADETTRVINLEGRTVIPGLIDNHIHLSSAAINRHLGVEVASLESIEELLDAISAKIDETDPGAAIQTASGVYANQFKEKRTPDKKDLDSVAPNNPVIIKGGHNFIVNSRTLEIANITKDTPSPNGGLIEKDPSTGEPTGNLTDNAMELVRDLLPTPTRDEEFKALKFAQAKENSMGITSIREPMLTPAEMRLYQELWRRRELTVRVSMNLHLDYNKPSDALIQELGHWGVTTNFGNPMLKLDGIGEFFVDGGFEGALMSKPYAHIGDGEDPSDFYGLQIVSEDKLEAVVLAMNELGWRGSIHAVGDKGIDILLDAYEKADAFKEIAGQRWVLEHGHCCRPDQYGRIRNLSVLVTAQFHPYLFAETMIHYWGEERAARSVPLREWLDAGLLVGGGSDLVAGPANPFWMLYFWITRNTRRWGVLGPEQRISREEALRVMTTNNAYITFDENIKGSIEPGKLADLLILSDDLLDAPEDRIKDIRPLVTIVDGEVVYQSDDSTIRIID